MQTTRRALAETAGMLALLASVSVTASAAEASAGEADASGLGAKIKQVLSEKLPNVPGKSLTAVVVTYGPGGKTPRHHHSGSVFAYILSGAIRSQVSGQGPAKVYTVGETFFEPPGSEHLVSANASTTESSSLLAVFVADTGAKLTIIDQ